VTGFEPASVRIQGGCLPIGYTGVVEPSVGIEPTPAAYETATRPSCCEGTYSSGNRNAAAKRHSENDAARSGATPGIEPEPPGLRPSAQTFHARVASRDVCARLAVVDILLSRPVGTVSLAFHCERLLGEPSIHVCCSRLQSGLRGSNSHFQSQSLVFCRLNETRSL
jgi:hypothetical protein